MTVNGEWWSGGVVREAPGECRGVVEGFAKRPANAGEGWRGATGCVIFVLCPLTPDS